MAFQFNFLAEQSATTEQSGSDVLQEQSKPSLVPHGRIHDPSTSAVVGNQKRLEYQIPGGFTVAMVNGGELSSNDEVANRTDVLKGRYEGGLKIWECSFDAMQYLSTKLDHTPRKFLDLGCGAGIVGIWALLNAPETQVCFQDLNESVLRTATISNVMQNFPSALSRSSFVFGAWSDLREELSSLGPFDVISSADTLYNEEYFPALHDIILSALDRDNGIAIISAKRFYFGVGGGVFSFMNYVKNRGLASVEVAMSFEDGVSNVRDVLLMRHAK